MIAKDKKEAKLLEGLQARIVVSTLSYNNSIVIVDENGESHKPPMPDPVEEELFVKQGDQVNGFEVLAVTTQFITLKSFTEYTVDNTSTPQTQFMIETGECIHLNMCGVCDAGHRISMKYIGVVASEDTDIDKILGGMT